MTNRYDLIATDGVPQSNGRVAYVACELGDLYFSCSPTLTVQSAMAATDDGEAGRPFKIVYRSAA